MLIFSRLVTLKGGVAAVMEYTHEVTTMVNDIVDVEVALSACGPGYPGNSFLWATAVESRAQLADTQAALLANSAYQEMVAKGLEFWTGPPLDRLREVLHLAGMSEGDTVSVGSTSTVVTADIANGKFGEAIPWSIELTDYASQIFGAPVAFTRSLAGSFSEVAWITVTETPADLDKIHQLELTDEGYGQRIDAAGELFVQGTAHRAYLTRIA